MKLWLQATVRLYVIEQTLQEIFETFKRLPNPQKFIKVMQYLEEFEKYLKIFKTEIYNKVLVAIIAEKLRGENNEWRERN